MRELDSIAIAGAGRLGTALAELVAAGTIPRGDEEAVVRRRAAVAEART